MESIGDWEACQAEAPVESQNDLQDGWEVIEHQDPWTGEWVQLMVPPEEVEKVWCFSKGRDPCIGEGSLTFETYLSWENLTATQPRLTLRIGPPAGRHSHPFHYSPRKTIPDTPPAVHPKAL